MLSAAWVVYVMISGCLVAAACAMAASFVQARRQPTRLIWIAGMGAMLLMSFSALGAPDSGNRVPQRPVAIALSQQVSASAASSHGILGAAGKMLHAARHALSHAMTIGIARTARMLPPLLGRGLVALWVLASLAALLVIVRVHCRISRLQRDWPRTQLHGYPVRIAPAVGPAVLGVLRATIVVPQWLLSRSEAEQRLVLAHESEHVRASDHRLLAVAWVAAALVAWHPAMWWMLSRLRLAIELDCDARVLRQGVAPRAYGRLLIDLAGQCSGFPVGATALADESSHLERRLLAMKSTALSHSRLRAGLLLTGGLVALLAACEAKIPTSADVQNMDVASAEQSAAGIRLVNNSGSQNTTYYVDDVKTDAATAHAIPRSRIASVEVRKLNGSSEMRIATVPNGASSASRTPVRVTVVEHDGSAAGSIDTVKNVIVTSQHGSAAADMTFTGVVFIDGVQVDAASLKTLDPATIVSMEVVKGPRATQQSSDPAAINGIIRVTTKAGSAAKE